MEKLLQIDPNNVGESWAAMQEQAKRVGARGEALYEADIRPLVDTSENLGKFVAIDVNTGSYEIGREHHVALQKIKANKPDALVVTLRIGYPATFSRGFRMLPLSHSLETPNAT